MREVWNKALNDYQREATTQFVNKKTDLFINLPTGYGKSLVYQALPLVFDTVHGTVGHRPRVLIILNEKPFRVHMENEPARLG